MIKLNDIKMTEYRVDDLNEWNELMKKLKQLELKYVDDENDSFCIDDNIGEIGGYMGDFTIYVDHCDGVLIGYSWVDDDLRIIAISDKMQRIIDGE